MSITDQVAEHRKQIRYETLTMSIAELMGMYTADPPEMVISPPFQRLFRWSREQQSNFVESLLLEIPIPPLFFYENDDGIWELLDGLQRISTLIRFLSPKFPVPDANQGEAANNNEWHFSNQNNVEQSLQLLPGEYLSEMNGRTFRSLPIQLQLNLKRTRIHVYVLKRETDSQYKYEVFKRINRGGTRLEDQEVRNVSIRMLDDVFPEYLKSISEYAPFVEALGLGGELLRNGYQQELALRFFAMKNQMDLFRHDVSLFLDQFMEGVAKAIVPFDRETEQVTFHCTFDLINGVLTDGEAFKGKTEGDRSRGPFSPSLFEAVSVGVARNLSALQSLDSETLRRRIINTIRTLKEEQLTGAGSNSRAKTLGRIDRATSVLEGASNDTSR